MIWTGRHGWREVLGGAGRGINHKGTETQRGQRQNMYGLLIPSCLSGAPWADLWLIPSSRDARRGHSLKVVVTLCAIVAPGLHTAPAESGGRSHTDTNRCVRASRSGLCRHARSVRRAGRVFPRGNRAVACGWAQRFQPGQKEWRSVAGSGGSCSFTKHLLHDHRTPAGCGPSQCSTQFPTANCQLFTIDPRLSTIDRITRSTQ